MTLDEFWTKEQSLEFRRLGMTDQELEAFMLVSLAAKKVLALPSLHNMHREEFCHDFHHIQNRILARPGCRAIDISDKKQ